MSDEKDRYFVTLSRGPTFEIKRILKELGLPLGHFSVLLDEYIIQVLPLFRELLKKKKNSDQITIYDIIEKANEGARNVSLRKADEELGK